MLECLRRYLKRSKKTPRAALNGKTDPFDLLVHFSSPFRTFDFSSFRRELTRFSAPGGVNLWWIKRSFLFRRYNFVLIRSCTCLPEFFVDDRILSQNCSIVSLEFMTLVHSSYGPRFTSFEPFHFSFLQRLYFSSNAKSHHYKQFYSLKRNKPQNSTFNKLLLIASHEKISWQYQFVCARDKKVNKLWQPMEIS